MISFVRNFLFVSFLNVFFLSVLFIDLLLLLESHSVKYQLFSRYVEKFPFENDYANYLRATVRQTMQWTSDWANGRTERMNRNNNSSDANNGTL